MWLCTEYYSRTCFPLVFSLLSFHLGCPLYPRRTPYSASSALIIDQKNPFSPLPRKITLVLSNKPRFPWYYFKIDSPLLLPLVVSPVFILLGCHFSSFSPFLFPFTSCSIYHIRHTPRGVWSRVYCSIYDSVTAIFPLEHLTVLSVPLFFRLSRIFAACEVAVVTCTHLSASGRPRIPHHFFSPSTSPHLAFLFKKQRDLTRRIGCSLAALGFVRASLASLYPLTGEICEFFTSPSYSPVSPSISLSPPPPSSPKRSTAHDSAFSLTCSVRSLLSRSLTTFT